MDTLIRSMVGFTVLLILTRLIGKKQIGQMNIFTYITGISLGSMAGEMVIYKDVKILDGIIAMTIWCVLVCLIERAGLKNAKARILLTGEPTIVIKKGEIIEKSLQKMRLNIDDLNMLLRTNQVFSILDVVYAILEPNGELSVMKKDMASGTGSNSPLQNNIPSEIIVDGKIVEKNLKELNFSKKRLDNELKKQGVKNMKQVVYAELQPNGSLYIQKRK